MKNFILIILMFASLSVVSQIQTVVLQPGSEDGYDSEVRTDLPDENNGDWFDFIANAWTAQGNFFIMRSFIRFDLSSIPANATVINATLDLYTNIYTGHYQLDSGPNTAYFMRIQEDWLEHQITWNNQPAASWEDYVMLLQSTSHDQTYHVDLTSHVQDMILHPETNFGWMFRLETEERYRCMVFCSSDHSNFNWRPRLTIIYSACLPPQADFSYSIHQETVQFTDLSSPVNNWNWDFGDHQTSAEQNPVHVYQYPGIYIVQLTVEDSCGAAINTDTLQIQCAPPVAGFYVNFIYPEVNFYDTTISTTIYDWYWDFGDESHSSDQNPIHIYDYPGIYKVCLFVMDSCSSDSVCSAIAYFPPKSVIFTSEPSAINGLEVAFTDKTKGATEWLWDFGDGTTSTIQNPIHIYKTYGKYEVCMQAVFGGSDVTFCDSLELKEKIIENPENKTTFYPNPPVNNKITVSFEKDAGYSDITLYDFIGKSIFHKRISPAKIQQPVELFLPELSSGMFIIKIELEGIQKIIKLVIP
jgi:PKD repeat protein